MANIKFFKKATRPTSAGVGSVWFDSNRKAIVLTGATAAEDVIYSGCITNAVVDGETLKLTKTDGTVITVDFAVFATDAALNAALTPINNSLGGKQDKTDNTLATTDKTVSGAINELNTKIGNLTGALTWKGKFDTLPAVTDYEAGNVIGVGNKEYVLTVTGSTKTWEELGDEGSYLLKSVAEETYLKKADGAVATANIADSAVTSKKLATGARNPIILTPSTREVDEETYQKLLSDDVDVMFKTAAGNANLSTLTYKVDMGSAFELYFTCFSIEGNAYSTYLYAYKVNITKASPHTCSITENVNDSLDSFITSAGFPNRDYINPVLQQIDLTGTDAERKAKLDQFAVDWKALTGADTLDGARFVGYSGEPDNFLGIFIYSSLMEGYSAIAMRDSLSTYQVFISPTGTIISNSLFYHLEPVIIRTGNTDSDMADNVAAIQKYINNLTFLGVYTYGGFTIPVSLTGNEFCGYLICNKYHEGDRLVLSGTVFFEGVIKSIVIDETGRYREIVDIAGTHPLNTTSDNMVDAINEVNTLAKSKQDALTSGTNIKTINNQSLLGSGNIEISAPSITVDTTMSDTSTNPVQNKVIKAYIDGLVGNVAAWIEYE